MAWCWLRILTNQNCSDSWSSSIRIVGGWSLSCLINSSTDGGLIEVTSHQTQWPSADKLPSRGERCTHATWAMEPSSPWIPGIEVVNFRVGKNNMIRLNKINKLADRCKLIEFTEWIEVARHSYGDFIAKSHWGSVKSCEMHVRKWSSRKTCGFPASNLWLAHQDD